MTEAGYRRCYNVAEGFEGQVDAEQHRGHKAGWIRRPAYLGRKPETGTYGRAAVQQ